MRPLAVVFILTLAAIFAGAANASEAIATAPPPPAAAPPATPSGDAEARYQALLAADKAGAPDVDWQALRVAFAERPTFRPGGQDAVKAGMFQAIDAGDCRAALASAKAVIAEAFVDADAHLVAAYCDDKAGDAADATWERDVGVGLLASIQTGDGLSPAAAFTPIDVGEEYSLMRAKGLKVTGQALVRQEGHAYDAITATGDQGQTTTYYFLVDRILGAEGAALAPGSAGGGAQPAYGP